MPKLRMKNLLLACISIAGMIFIFNYVGIEGMKDLTELSMPEDFQEDSKSGTESASEEMHESEAELERPLEIINDNDEYVIRNPAKQSNMNEFDEIEEAKKMRVYDPPDDDKWEDESVWIPQKIWQTAKNPFERDVLKYTRFWRSNHPSYTHYVLDDAQCERLVTRNFGNPSFSKISSAYQMMPLPVLKADFFRYLVLLAQGGIYTDIDTTPIKHIREWIPREFEKENIGLVVGIEADPDRPDWYDHYARRIQFCQWTIAATPGHPVLWELVHKITMGTWSLHEKGQLSEDKDAVMDWTGPGIWTDSVFDYLNWRYGPFTWENVTGIETPKLVGDVLILPITSFSPGVGHMGSKSANDPTAYVKHYFSGSWKVLLITSLLNCMSEKK
ncbi:alpha-1,6-mannosyltransferase Och1 [Schizosaccharomyces cryophilus OY26]|uniref:Alpha-1,6-mannosyltransferase Och1 n=1 Tax=Schizosaccharomyces cryophilus (strain OY26 / ATCC MYA-4695 / CBS 11777 / NBRC 106824 / NRRL Y48691) TaxID=653667 RepID=S9VQN1_SCHCR|nr:alpha-1,6-mannosyltransferase Och1 [Schizosaccharomyces cryophilus OY26]EPY50253.1 alpha-1,6-mannosyltransferase Och1 [Schizosaccharomyces cryophilus OY26]